MNTSKMKNMVILKDLPSNIIDEAIIILKPNIKVKNFDMAESKKSSYKNDGNKRDSKDYIVNEAQMVISNYISNIEAQKDIRYKKLEKENKNKTLKTAMITLAILGVIMYILRFV